LQANNDIGAFSPTVIGITPERDSTFLALAVSQVKIKNRHYCIQHASGLLTRTTSALWHQHIESGELIKVRGRLARVAPELMCWADRDQLHFAQRVRTFSGNRAIPSQWEAVIKSWLYRPPFPKPEDLAFLIRQEQLTLIQASAQALSRQTK